MKKSRQIFLTTFIALIFVVRASAQDTTQNIFTVKTDIFFPIASISSNGIAGSLTLEKGFKRRHSFQLTGLYFNQQDDSIKYLKDISVFIMEEYKFFWRKKKSFTGFYSGLNVAQIMYKINGIDNSLSPLFYVDYRGYCLGGGLLIGYQNYIRKKFTIDVLLGFGWSYLIMEQSGYFNPPSIPYVRTAINLGYRFGNKK